MGELPPFNKILSQLGLSKSLQRIKFGGVVGKQTLLCVIAIIVLASIAWRADPKEALTIAVLAAFLTLIVVILNFFYAHKHPMEATLEGAEMLALQHQVLASKSVEPPRDSPIVPNPGGAPPQLNPPEENEQ